MISPSIEAIGRRVCYTPGNGGPTRYGTITKPYAGNASNSVWVKYDGEDGVPTQPPLLTDCSRLEFIRETDAATWVDPSPLNTDPGGIAATYPTFEAMQADIDARTREHKDPVSIRVALGGLTVWTEPRGNLELVSPTEKWSVLGVALPSPVAEALAELITRADHNPPYPAEALGIPTPGPRILALLLNILQTMGPDEPAARDLSKWLLRVQLVLTLRTLSKDPVP